MPANGRIGTHGEFVFQALISRRCGRKFYFHPIHMGEKHPTADMVVELLDPTNVQSLFYVQVKSSTLGCSGTGAAEKLKVDISREDIEKLKGYPGPTYIAGIDIFRGRGYLAGVDSGLNKAINGLRTCHPIDCRNIRRLWTEVDAYWNSPQRSIPLASTKFAI